MIMEIPPSQTALALENEARSRAFEVLVQFKAKGRGLN
jgi:hypothetical protein